MSAAMRLAATLVAAVTMSLISGAAAFENDAPLDDPALEARAVALAKELRCLVCQNQSIMESDADLAKDLRRIVRERVVAGESDDDVNAYIVARYGDFVLLRPPFKPKTWVLWFGPAVIVAGALAGLVVFWRRRIAAPAVPAALSDDERARVARLLEDGPEA
jgi:cytochrome c-type biogenesis protein CcmH